MSFRDPLAAALARTEAAEARATAAECDAREAAAMADEHIPRYVRYARSQGRTVEAQSAHDRESTLRMIPYMLWCHARLAEWWALVGRTERWPVLPVMSAADHEAFDAWLAASVTAPDDARERGR